MPEATLRLRNGRVVTVAQFGWQWGVGLRIKRKQRVFYAILPGGEKVTIAPDGHAKAEVLKFKE